MALTKSRITQYWGTTYDDMMAQLPPPQDFELQSFDGIQLKGKYFQKTATANCAIILSHGWTSNWAGMLKYVPALADCDCDLVFYDMRAHGESGGDHATGSIKEAKDLLAVTNWLAKTKGYTYDQIGWLGGSWGAAATLLAGADSQNVAFIIADSPFQDWYSAIFERAIRDYGSVVKFMSFGVMQTVNFRTGVDYKAASARLAAAQIDEPVLLIHSQMDDETASQQSANIAEHLTKTNQRFHHSNWGGGHTKDVLVNTEKFKNEVNLFLKEIKFATN